MFIKYLVLCFFGSLALALYVTAPMTWEEVAMIVGAFAAIGAFVIVIGYVMLLDMHDQFD